MEVFNLRLVDGVSAKFDATTIMFTYRVHPPEGLPYDMPFIVDRPDATSAANVQLLREGGYVRPVGVNQQVINSSFFAGKNWFFRWRLKRKLKNLQISQI
jgi:hypothetical protein